LKIPAQKRDARKSRDNNSSRNIGNSSNNFGNNRIYSCIRDVGDARFNVDCRDNSKKTLATSETLSTAGMPAMYLGLRQQQGIHKQQDASNSRKVSSTTARRYASKRKTMVA
jgi:hypothetical protein